MYKQMSVEYFLATSALSPGADEPTPVPAGLYEE